MRIKKAVIPAAGLGTRVLPATKAMPKEMYPIIDKPTIQYIVEEAVASGITDILIVTSRGKNNIEDHFDTSPELENILLEKGKKELAKEIYKISSLAHIYFTRQNSPIGLGHAVSLAERFVGNEPFAVLFGDDLITAEVPVCKQLIDAYEEFGLGVVAAKEVPKEDIHKYGSLEVKNIRDNLYMCTDMIEKPAENEILSLFSILGRCVLPPEIFKILKEIPKGAGGEYQLTDAMKVLAHEKGIIAVDFFGKRYDIGNKFGIVEAVVETALKHPEISAQTRRFIKDLSMNI